MVAGQGLVLRQSYQLTTGRGSDFVASGGRTDALAIRIHSALLAVLALVGLAGFGPAADAAAAAKATKPAAAKATKPAAAKKSPPAAAKKTTTAASAKGAPIPRPRPVAADAR